MQKPKKKLQQIEQDLLKVQGKLTTLEEFARKREKLLAELQPYSVFKNVNLDGVLKEVAHLHEQRKLLNQELLEYEQVSTSKKQAGLPKLNLALVFLLSLVVTGTSIGIGFTVNNTLISILGGFAALMVFIAVLYFKLKERNLKRGSVVLEKDLASAKTKLSRLMISLPIKPSIPL